MTAHDTSQAPGIPRQLPLVGRHDELARLQLLFADERKTEPMVLLTGDAGVGKSRLVETLEGEARRREWTVASGRAYPVESGMPYSLLSDAFLPILRSFDDATLTVLTRGGSGDLRQLFPALGPAETPMEDWDPTESRTRLFWTFTEFVKRLAERSPLLVVVEDLHWADASSLSLLHFMVRQLQDEPIRILGTATSDYGPDTEALSRVERSLASLGKMDSQTVPPLPQQAVEELLVEVFQVGRSPLREFATHLYAWTHGNPYFLEETLKALVDSGRLHHRDGTWLGWEVRNLDLPGTVRDALLLRLGSLSRSARAVADLLAVSGGRAAVPLVGRVGEMDQEALLEAVEELVTRGVIEESEEDQEVVLELRHPMLRETIYRNLGATRRQLLHRQLGEALEALHRNGKPPVDQLAYHFTRGGSSEEDQRVVRYLAQAGRSALRRHADREGVAYLEAALGAAPSPDDSTDGRISADTPSREEIQVDLARGQARLGNRAAAAELWNALLESARSRNDDEGTGEALRHLGLLAYWGGEKEKALDYYEKALGEIADRGREALEARILLAVGVALQELGRADEALTRIEASLALARSLEDPMLVGRGHRALALLYTWLGQSEEARRHGWQAVEMGDRAGDPYVRFWARWALAALEGLTGNTAEMNRLVGQAQQVADELHSPVLRLWTAELEVEYLFASGDWDAALAQGERSIVLARNLNQNPILARLLVWTATVYTGRGDMTRANELVDRAWSLAGLDEGTARVGDVHVAVPAHIGRATCLLAEERYAEAVEVGTAGLEMADAAGYVFWSLHMLLPVIAEAFIRQRDVEGAKEVGRRMRSSGKRMGHRLATAWADACDALVQWISNEGDPSRAVDLMAGAAEALEAIPWLYDAARVRRQLAGRLASAGRRDEALALLRNVHEVFVGLGAQPELDKTRDMFRELNARVPSLIRVGTAELTPREWEVAQLVAGRNSNKACAKAMGIKERTVTTFLTSIYRKLGINRSQLIDMVREGRLRPVDRE